MLSRAVMQRTLITLAVCCLTSGVALGAGLERVGALAGTPPVVVPPPTKTEAHSNERLACARFGIGAQLTRRLCKLYAVDFECFGYELPEVCRG